MRDENDTIRTLSVPEELEELRCDRFLSEELPEYSRTYLQKLFGEGRVEVSGKTIKGSRKMKTGELVSVRIPAPEELKALPEDIPLSILYEDEELLIVNKPKGMVVHPAPGNLSGTLVNAVLFHCRDELSGINGVLRPGIVHRIDKNTTGSLIVCKTDAAHRLIAGQLKDHSIHRLYRGIVCGRIAEDSFTVEGNIGRDQRDRKKMTVVREGGKPALTHGRVLERFRNYTYCEFRLETGRTHQIRVHMAHIGHPLLGDDVYGPKKCPFSLEGQTLHAMTIGFVHPGTKEYVEFSAPLPDYFKDLLRIL
ncbi:MAG: RluA family pseudouridine synthase [Lachnospiraceae bacterium]|nr:RluA family pseudouridine synthase [Lachnospiraceae bacterium]